MSSFDLGQIQGSGASGLDALFETSPQLVTPVRRRKIASLADLKGFERVSSDTLVHKSRQELWSLQKADDGKFYISRLFDGNGSPIQEK